MVRFESDKLTARTRFETQQHKTKFVYPIFHSLSNIVSKKNFMLSVFLKISVLGKRSVTLRRQILTKCQTTRPTECTVWYKPRVIKLWQLIPRPPLQLWARISFLACMPCLYVVSSKRKLLLCCGPTAMLSSSSCFLILSPACLISPPPLPLSSARFISVKWRRGREKPNSAVCVYRTMKSPQIGQQQKMPNI